MCRPGSSSFNITASVALMMPAPTRMTSGLLVDALIGTPRFGLLGYCDFAFLELLDSFARAVLQSGRNRQNPLGLSQHRGLHDMPIQDRDLRARRGARRQNGAGMRHSVGRRRKDRVDRR